MLLHCFEMRVFLLLFLILITHRHVKSLALLPREETITSKVVNTQCRLQLSIGRVPGSAMPQDWAASGAKLALPNLVVEFTDDACEYEMSKERFLNSSQKSFLSMKPLTQPSFVSLKGEQEVKVTDGAYSFELSRIEALRYNFRFFLDFPDGATRNDVQLPAERIFFSSICWLADEKTIKNAERRKKEFEKKLGEVEKEISELQEKSTNFFSKALALRPSILLFEQRDLLSKQISELQQIYPLVKDDIVRGPNGTLFVKEGYMAVKRYAGALGSQEQYHWVGKFQIKDFQEGDVVVS